MGEPGKRPLLPPGLRGVTGELVLIVAGVLIALGADSWWQGRLEIQSTRVYLEQLRNDVRETEARLMEAIRDDSTYLDIVNTSVRAAEGEAPADSFRTLSAFSIFEPVIGTAQSLVQSGAIELVESDSIRLEIVGWLSALTASRDWLAHTEDQTWLNSRRIIERQAEYSRAPAELRREGRYFVAADRDSMLADPVLYAAMELQRALQRNRLNRLNALLGPTVRLRGFLERELGNR
jgi:hypothetical protein